VIVEDVVAVKIEVLVIVYGNYLKDIKKVWDLREKIALTLKQ
jgi:hypothetical protein